MIGFDIGGRIRGRKMEELLKRYPCLEKCRSDIEAAVNMLKSSYKQGGKLLVCGNGGSSADSDHIVGELMKGFLLKRKPSEEFKAKLESLGYEDADFIAENLQDALPAISLPAQSAVISAFANDVSADMVYAQLVYGYGSESDAFLGISTSGNSKNIIYAAKVAKAKGLKTLALTGSNGGLLSEICDITVKVPETETFKVQELHLPVYHYICYELEKEFFEK